MVYLLAMLLPCSALAQVPGSRSLRGTVFAPAPDQAAPCGSPGHAAEPAALLQVNFIAPTPLLASDVDWNKVPSQNQVLTSREVTPQRPPSYSGRLQHI